jgi:hypothetical protein
MLGQATVNVLPDDVLLDIFDFYRGDDEYFTFHPRDVETAGTCMPKVAKHHLCVPPASVPGTPM